MAINLPAASVHVTFVVAAAGDVGGVAPRAIEAADAESAARAFLALLPFGAEPESLIVCCPGKMSIFDFQHGVAVDVNLSLKWR